MLELAAKLNHPLLACNCYVKATGELAYPAFTVIERSGVRVGIIGIAATILDKTMPPKFNEGLRFTLGNEELPGHIRTLRERERAELVVVLSHLGFPQDVKLAAEFEGIDVLLSGHTHNRMVEPLVVNGATIIQSGCHGSFVGRLDVELTGQEMWYMIEDNLEHTLAADPYQQMGGYVKRCLGLTFYVKLENPAGSRLQQCFIGSEELKRDGSYTAAFVTTQGVPKRYGRNRRDLELHAIDALKRYCAAHPCVNADLRGTVIAV
jgi:hypothetical protein